MHFVDTERRISFWNHGAEEITGYLSQQVLGRHMSEDFDSGRAKMSLDGQDLLTTLAQELGKLPNTLAMEGHTDSKPYAVGSSYGNWELSSDRANAARPVMQSNGIREDQVTQVRGFADQRLRKKEDPLHPANRRISLIVEYLN